MNNENDPKSAQPPEARRRGGMDTLFSAAWFDEEAVAKAKAEGQARAEAREAGGGEGAEDAPEPKSNRTLLIVAGVGAVIVLGGLLCAGVAAAVGAGFYFAPGAAG